MGTSSTKESKQQKHNINYGPSDLIEKTQETKVVLHENYGATERLPILKGIPANYTYLHHFTLGVKT